MLYSTSAGSNSIVANFKKNPQESEWCISTIDWTSGLYLIKVWSDAKEYNIKWIKKS
jgi:hypothetical protein